MEGPVDVEEVSLQKRHRSRNFTKYEKDVFYTVFSQYASIINDKATSADTIRDAWDRLVAEYNSQHNVYPRTRRQLQVLWRDEKFRAKKKVRKEQESAGHGVAEQTSPVMAPLVATTRSVSNESRPHPGNLLTPLLTVIKREREAYAAGETTIVPLTQYHSEDDQVSRDSHTNNERVNDESRRSRTYASCPSSESYTNNGDEDDPMSPLPVETELHSVTNSPVDTPSHEDGHSRTPDDTSYWEASNHRRDQTGGATRLESNVSPEPEAAERRAKEYHRLRMAQLRDEGAARLRVLEAELALHSQERHMRQQEHQIRMEILMEKLKRVREGDRVKD